MQFNRVSFLEEKNNFSKYIKIKNFINFKVLNTNFGTNDFAVKKKIFFLQY